ncbi:MAG: polysaccharide biosynthesis protein [Raoultibacter sp.]
MDSKPLSIKANMLWNSAGSLVYLACQWLTTILVVRLSSGYDAAGLLALAMSIVGIFGTFANYKMGTYQISDIRHENTVGEYLGFRCITLALACAACLVYAAFTCPDYAIVTVGLFFVYKGVGLLIDILHGLDQQNRRMDYIGKSFIAQGVLSLLAFAIVFYFSADLNAAIIAMTVAALGVLVFFDTPRAAQFEALKVHISGKKAFFFFKTSLPAVLAALAASAIFAIPKQYLCSVMGDASLGIYASVAAPALVIQMGAVYLYGPLLDIFPQLFFDGEIKKFRTLMLKTVGGILVVTLVCSMVLELIGSWALQLLFGMSIAPYIYLLQPIIFSTALTAYLWFFGDILIALRNFKANFIGNVVAFVLVIPFSFICVNAWGMNGVSFAGALACLCGVGCLLVSLIAMVKAPREKTRTFVEDDKE